MCVQANLSCCLMCKVLRAVESLLLGYNDLQGGFEELWSIGDWGLAEESGILQRHAQGCVEPSRGLEDPKLPLSAPNGVQSSLLHLRSSWKENSANYFALTEF
jgi:hypothetical protein